MHKLFEDFFDRTDTEDMVYVEKEDVSNLYQYKIRFIIYTESTCENIDASMYQSLIDKVVYYLDISNIFDNYKTGELRNVLNDSVFDFKNEKPLGSMVYVDVEFNSNIKSYKSIEKMFDIIYLREYSKFIKITDVKLYKNGSSDAPLSLSRHHIRVGFLHNKKSKLSTIGHVAKFFGFELKMSQIEKVDDNYVYDAICLPANDIIRVEDSIGTIYSMKPQSGAIMMRVCDGFQFIWINTYPFDDQRNIVSDVRKWLSETPHQIEVFFDKSDASMHQMIVLVKDFYDSDNVIMFISPYEGTMKTFLENNTDYTEDKIRKMMALYRR